MNSTVIIGIVLGIIFLIGILLVKQSRMNNDPHQRMLFDQINILFDQFESEEISENELYVGILSVLSQSRKRIHLISMFKTAYPQRYTIVREVGYQIHMNS